MKVDWKSTLTDKDDSIVDAMKIIDQDSLRVACVVDKKMNLLGLVTDGDVRRAIIAGKTLDSPVKEIMNSNPRWVDPDYKRDDVLDILKKNSLLHMPVVDNGVLVGLVTLEELLSPSRKSNPVFIMAGGFGTRLKPLTDNCPKPLLKVGDRPILEIIIDNFIKDGFYNFYISTHYLPDMIKSYFGDGRDKDVNISYVYEETPLGTGGALGLLPKDEIKESLIMVNGDILTNINFSQLLCYHNSFGASATMAVREYDYKIPYGVVDINNNKLEKLVEKPTYSFFVNAGIYVLEPNLVYSVDQNQKINITTLLESKVEEDSGVGIFPIHEYWLDIGQMDEYKRAQIDIMNMNI